MIPMHRKFNDDIFAHFFSYHEKCRSLICKGIKRADFDDIDDVIIMKNTFFA